MANIMINQICNLNCKYCFADDLVNTDTSANMTFENFKKAVDFHDRYKDRIGIIGGEPTIHPQFEEFLDYAVRYGKPEHIVVFSNGIELHKYWKSLIDAKVKVLINYNQEDISGNQHERILKSLDILHEEYNLGSKINIGINIHQAGMKFDQLFKLLIKYRKASCRFSLVVPNNIQERSFNALAYFRSMMPTLLEFLELCYLNNISPEMDCNMVPRCIYSTSECQEMMEKLKDLFGMNLRLFENAVCTPVLDIQPDLTIVRCFGMSQHRSLVMNNYSDLKSINDVFVNMTDTLGKIIPMSEECNECLYYATGKCYGGCLGYKLDKIKEASKLMCKFC